MQRIIDYKAVSFVSDSINSPRPMDAYIYISGLGPPFIDMDKL